MRRVCRLLLIAAVLVAIPLYADAAPPTPQRQHPPQPTLVRYTTQRVMVASTTADGMAAVLAPEGGGPAINAAVDGKTRYVREDGHANDPAFVVGAKLVVRLAVPGSSQDGQGQVQEQARVVELWDVARYEREQQARRAVCVGRVEATLPPDATAGTLSIRRDDGALLDFRVTEKTQFRRGDAVVTSAAYPVGAAVAVKPRGLPKGGIMASIVADSLPAVNAAYRDTLTVWHGTVQTVDNANYFLVITRDDGARRIVHLPRTSFSITDEKTEKVQGPRKLYYLAELPKLSVVIHLERGERPGLDGARTAVLISVTGHAPHTGTRTGAADNKRETPTPTAPAVTTP